MRKKFKVGDIVIGNEKNPYGPSLSKTKCEVINLFGAGTIPLGYSDVSIDSGDEDMRVKIIGDCGIEGKNFNVKSDYYDLVGTEHKFISKKKGKYDIIIGKKKIRKKIK